jgi:hypothetical protein
VRGRFAPRQLRDAHAVAMAREGDPLIIIRRQRGPTNLGISSIYLQSIDSTENTVHARRPRAAPLTPRADTGRARTPPSRREQRGGTLVPG